MTKKSRQKFKYLENEKSFTGQIKSKGLSIPKNCLTPESLPLSKFQVILCILNLHLCSFNGCFNGYSLIQLKKKIG